MINIYLYGSNNLKKESTSVGYETKTYSIPKVSEENFDVIERFLSRWDDDIEDYEWIPTDDGLGEFRLTADNQIAELIIVWIRRHGLTDDRKSIRYYRQESIKKVHKIK